MVVTAMRSTTSQCLASLARRGLSSTTTTTTPSVVVPRFLAPAVTTTTTTTTNAATRPISTTSLRPASMSTMMMAKREREKAKLKKKKRQARHKEYKYAVPSVEEQFSLCDAMRYLRAAEVGRPPTSVLYEVALKIRTVKNGPVCRGRVRFPTPVKDDVRVGVICRPDTGAWQEARAVGAIAYGLDDLFALIRNQASNLPFNRLICHVDAEPDLKKANLGRILGPRGLMPSLKTGTITRSVRGLMQDLVGSETYRERIGVVRMAVGNIHFTPKQLSENIKVIVSSVRSDTVIIGERTNIRKDLVEVVLSSTGGPGFSLNGGFMPTDAMQVDDLVGPI